MRVRKINIVHKMTTHVTNMFRIWFSPEKRVFKGCSDYIIQKNQIASPIF